MKTHSLLFALLVMLCSCGKTNKHADQMATKTNDIRLGTTKIHYAEAGSGDTILLFVHGWCINGSYWNNQLNYFSKHYRVLAPDLPGFGQSTAQRENWTIEKHADDLVEFITQLKLHNVILIGHSMSGDIVLEVALKNHPAVIGIVGIDNFKTVGLRFSPEQVRQMTAAVEQLQADFRNAAPAYAEKMLLLPTSPEAIKTRVKTDFANANETVALSSLQSQVAYGKTEAQQLEKLNYKLYLVNCADLMPANVDGLKKHCGKSFEIEDLHGSGHFPMIEKPYEFNKLLEKMVRKI